MVKMIGNTFLLILEYCFKLSSGVAGVIVLGTTGSFYDKLSTGYLSLFPVLGQISEFPNKIINSTTVINDYNTLTAAAFNQRYGGQAVNHVMASMNEGVAYIQAVYQNLSFQPATTLLALTLAVLSLYILGRAVCFFRQRGQGSFFTRMERHMGNRLFYDKPAPRIQP
ncbi:MAG: hypothetical protein WD037_10720 [Balneolales bacterium]